MVNSSTCWGTIIAGLTLSSKVLSLFILKLNQHSLISPSGADDDGIEVTTVVQRVVPAADMMVSKPPCLLTIISYRMRWQYVRPSLSPRFGINDHCYQAGCCQHTASRVYGVWAELWARHDVVRIPGLDGRLAGNLRAPCVLRSHVTISYYGDRTAVSSR